jgi:hypothetical protein
VQPFQQMPAFGGTAISRRGVGAVHHDRSQRWLVQ